MTYHSLEWLIAPLSAATIRLVPSSYGNHTATGMEDSVGLITDRQMQARPQAADLWHIEPAPRGHGRFMGRITPAGERLFYFRYTRSDGTRDTLLIGPYAGGSDRPGAYSLEQARDIAAEWRALYRSGVTDLRAHFAAEQQAAATRAESDLIEVQTALQRQREQAAAEELARQRRITVRQLFDRWAETELAPRSRADGTRTGRKDGGDFARKQFERRVFPVVGHIAVADLRKADLLAVLDQAKRDGLLRTCNMLLTDLKQMLRFAATREVVETNVLDGVTKRDAGGIEASRERALSPAEITELAARLPTARMHRRSELAIWLILGTACRAGELAGAAWAADRGQEARLREEARAADVKLGFVDLDARTWEITETKNQRPHTIHLSAFALDCLTELWQLRELGTSWVFPGTDRTLPVCVKSLAKQLSDRQRREDQRMQHRAKNTSALLLPGGRWTPHDLRRTAATLMASLGVSGDVIDECLNHVIESRVRRTYIRDRRPAEQARAFEALGQRLRELTTGAGTASNVVPLKRAA
jgi:integrase